MKSGKQTEKWAEILFLSGISLVCFVFLNILITAALLLVNVSVTAITPVLALAGACAITVMLNSRCAPLQERSSAITALFAAVALIVVCVAVSMLVCDRSYDGNYYHKVAIGSLANGWNPLYEGVVEFWQRASFPMPVTNDDALWVDHYAKASYFYAAPIYALTGNIEAGKSINLISLLALFLLWCGYLLHRKKHPLFVLIFGGVLASCPIFGAQLLTNYIDLLVGIYLFIIILVFFVFEEETFFGRSGAVHLLLFMSLGIMINIKFSSFGYAGLFCLGYYLWYMYRVWKQELAMKELIRLTVNAAAAVAVGVLVIGLSVYGKNFVDHGHPFYPLFGEGKIDIMGINQPACFAGMSAVEKFFYATFSYAENIIEADGMKPVLKIPFTMTQTELWSIPAMDLRISGYGVWFGGILILCVLLFALTVKSVWKNNRLLFMLTVIPLGITLVMIPCFGESWWARYFPQLYLLPLFVLLYLEDSGARLKTAVIGLMAALLLVNNGLTFGTASLAALRMTSEVNGQLAYMEQTVSESDGVTVLKAGPIRGALYNAVDRLEDGTVYVVQSENDAAAASATEPMYMNFVYWGIMHE